MMKRLLQIALVQSSDWLEPEEEARDLESLVTIYVICVFTLR